MLVPDRIVSTSPHLYRRWVILTLFLVNVINQWDKYLLPYLSGISAEQCAELCKNVAQQYCNTCPAGDGRCDACQSCRSDAKIGFHNMQDGTCLTGVQYGMLTGLAFSFTFAVCAVLLGPLVDRWNRRNLLTLAVILWSLASASQAIGHNFWDILYSRLGLGITESLAAPACYALIAAYFPMAERGAANGVYSCGIYIGGGLASLSILIARSAGWRMACVIVGGIGIAIGILLLCTVKEPKESSPDARVDASASADDAHAQSFALLHREDSALLEGSTADDEHTPSLPPNEVTPIVRRSRGGSFEDHAALVPVPLLSQSAPVVSQELLRPETVSVARRPQDNSMTVNREPVTLSQSFRAILSRKVVLLLYAAGCMRFIGGNAIGSFLVKYFQAAFPAHNKDYSVVNAVVIGVGGALSSAGGGYLADFLSRKYGYHTRPYVPLFGSLLAVPCMAGVVLFPSFPAAMFALFLEYVFAENWFGPTMSVMQSELPLNAVGLGTSINVLLTTCFGSISPPILGAFYDAAVDKTDIRWSLLISVAFSYTSAALFFWLAVRELKNRDTRSTRPVQFELGQPKYSRGGVVREDSKLWTQLLEEREQFSPLATSTPGTAREVHLDPMDTEESSLDSSYQEYDSSEITRRYLSENDEPLPNATSSSVFA